MVNPADVHGKRLAMVAWGKKPDGTDEAVVFTGTGRWDDGQLTMVRGQSSFQIHDEWLGRLKIVDADLKSALLEADYYFNVTIGPLPDGADLTQYLETGLKWPGITDAS